MLRKLANTGILLFLTSSIVAQHHADKPATHGMLLMGSETIYASHLPMFHSPHDYQIILRLRFDAEGSQKYVEDRQAHPGELVYTIEPEVFVLPQMVNHTKKFKGNVYRGHFERGGEMIAKEVSVTIEQVVYYTQFKSEAKKPTYLKYILFGNDKEQFLAHQISARPDFDEVLAVKIKGKESLFKNAPYQILDFNEKEDRKPFSWKTPSGKTDKQQVLDLADHRQLYFELGDLE